jgi:hypothetical protein
MPLFLLFNTQAMQIKSFYTQQHCYVSLKTLYTGGIWTRVFLFLRQMWCPLCQGRQVFLNLQKLAKFVGYFFPR